MFEIPKTSMHRLIADLEDSPPSAWLARIQSLLETKQPFLAFDLSKEATRLHPNDESLALASVLALMHGHSLRAAHAALEDYPESVDASLSVPAREVLAEILRLDWSKRQARDTLTRARSLYSDLFHLTRHYAHGMQASLLSLHLDDRAGANTLAAELYDMCTGDNTLPDPDPFRVNLHTGHAALLMQRPDEALFAYQRAISFIGQDYHPVIAALESFRDFSAAGVNVPDQVFELFEPPRIVVFGGQPIDPPGLDEPVFPPDKEAAVRAAIAEQLADIDARIGYSSAACGSDILFLEALLERGGEAHILLPCSLDDFIAARVVYAGEGWVERLQKVLEQAATVTYATEEHYLGHRTLLRYANHMIAGSGWLRGQLINSKPHLLAVWDYRAANLPGSSSDFIDQWPDMTRLHLIDLDELPGKPDSQAPIPSMPAFNTPPNKERVIRTMLFADVVGYSKMGEEYLQQWLDLLHHIREMCDALEVQPDLVEAWGDAFYIVLPNARALIKFAFTLRRAFTALDHTRFGLPRQLNIRIGLHAGPVFRDIHPMSGRVVFMGRQVNRAARIEPITMPGEVYASQELVALLTAEENAARHEQSFAGVSYEPWFKCEYLGVIDMPKKHGQQPVYHLLPNEADERQEKTTPAAESAQRLHLTLQNDLGELARLADKLERFSAQNNLSEEEAYNLNLVFDELITNIIQYGFEPGNESHHIELFLRTDEDWLRAELIDDGYAYNPLTETPDPDLDTTLEERAIGGLGVYLVNQLMDDLDYRREGGFNRLKLARRRNAAAADDMTRC